jgi:hypothetical protein
VFDEVGGFYGAKILDTAIRKEDIFGEMKGA